MTTRAATSALSEPAGAGRAATAAKPRSDFHPELDGVYLFHWILYAAIVRQDAFGLKTASPWANFVIVGAATIASALLSWNLAEKQFLKLKWRTSVPRI
jgi:hypothetical protein